MKRSKILWRTLLFVFLIAALCGNFALPVVNVSAAPRMVVAPGDVVISEFRRRGNNPGKEANDEFVELYNVTGGEIDISGLEIWGSNNNNPPTTSRRLTILSNTLLEPGQHYLVANSGGYNNPTVAPDQTYGVGIADNGGIALIVPGVGIIDQVGMGNNSAYKEGTLLAPLTANANQSYERKLGGTQGSCVDVNDNLADFGATPISPSDPQNSSSAFVYCQGLQTYTPTDTLVPTDTPTPTSTPTITPLRSVVINEVAWGGTTAASKDEWLELWNTTASDINLSGWHLTVDGGWDITLSGTISAGKYFVIAQNSSLFKGLTPDKTYSVISLNNAGQILSLTDSLGNQVDTANLDGGAWPAGTGSPKYQTMERNGNVADSATAWATYGGTGSTVQDRNGNSIQGTPGDANWVVTAPPTATPTSTPTVTPTGTAAASLSVLINEVAWSGTAAKSDDEWIELRNPGSLPINITGWRLYGDDNTFGKVGSPNITLTGTIPAGGYFLLERDQLATDVVADQVYSSGDLLNTGERLYLKDKSGNTIDTANLDGGSWPAGTATSTSTSVPSYASMERVGTNGNQWATYGGNVVLAHDRSGNAIKGTPGRANWISTTTITTITLDSPDPSLVNQNVTVSVRVSGGNSTPTGIVSITGANTNCTLTLSGGVGSCLVKFTSVGSKTLTATYSGDGNHPASSDTEAHTVSTSTFYQTPTPIPAPPPQLVVINELVPRPGHDWNHDGVVNVGDEYIELLNHGTVDVNLSGWRLDDEVNTGSDPYSLPAKVLKPGERIVFYGSETGLLLSDGGDAVRLLKQNGQLMDAYNYSIASYPDQSFCRLPDNGGADDWTKNCYPTPGLQNSLSGNGTAGSKGIGQESLCPIADTLPYDFVWAECDPFGSNIFRPSFWDQTGWYDDKSLPIDGKWVIFAD